MKEGDGYWESFGTPVLPRSLYLQQLEDRLGEQAVLNITTEEQRARSLWDKLASWEGRYLTGVMEQEKPSPPVKFFPNPVNNQLHIDLTDLPSDRVSVMLYDALGRSVYREEVTGGAINQIQIPEPIHQDFLILKVAAGHHLYVEKVVME